MQLSSGKEKESVESSRGRGECSMCRKERQGVVRLFQLLLRNLGGPAALLFGRLALCCLVLLFVVLLGSCGRFWVLRRTTAGPLRDINLTLGFGLMEKDMISK